MQERLRGDPRTAGTVNSAVTTATPASDNTSGEVISVRSRPGSRPGSRIRIRIPASGCTLKRPRSRSAKPGRGRPLKVVQKRIIHDVSPAAMRLQRLHGAVNDGADIGFAQAGDTRDSPVRQARAAFQREQFTIPIRQRCQQRALSRAISTAVLRHPPA